MIERRLTDTVSVRFDAGTRLMAVVERDVLAVCVGPEQCCVAVGTPAHLPGRPRLKALQDSTAHRCIPHGSTSATQAT